MPPIRGKKRERVRDRAEGICEYCRLHERFFLAGVSDFEAEHIRPDYSFVKGDPAADDEMNLAWACPRCNNAKRVKTDGIDPATGYQERLFNPRLDRWEDHFVALRTGHIEGRTPIGRSTVVVLKMNDARAVENRRLDYEIGRWPSVSTPA